MNGLVFTDIKYQALHPWHWLTYGNNAAAVAALVAVAAFIGLVIYAWDTRLMRIHMAQQVKAAQRPFICIEKKKLGRNRQDMQCESALWAVNSGLGPVGDSYWKVGIRNRLKSEPDTVWHKMGAIAPKDGSYLAEVLGKPVLMKVPEDGIRIHYRDTAHNWYALIFVQESRNWFTDTEGLSPGDISTPSVVLTQGARQASIRIRRRLAHAERNSHRR